MKNTNESHLHKAWCWASGLIEIGSQPPQDKSNGEGCIVFATGPKERLVAVITTLNSAKVEVDYLKATDQSSTPFLEVPPDAPYVTLPAGQPSNGITNITRHTLRG